MCLHSGEAALLRRNEHSHTSSWSTLCLLYIKTNQALSPPQSNLRIIGCFGEETQEEQLTMQKD